ncbi:hypothetical protein L4C36_22680 [Photobacterium japonica]|uniref:hypothetical protein n=1 Tax=Photobacterium japonica TaxID=2910235 RepID=UPI003D1504BA
MNRTQRIAAARARLLSRYPDRDEVEVRRMESFRGLSKDELKRRFEDAARERGIRVRDEQERELTAN